MLDVHCLPLLLRHTHSLPPWLSDGLLNLSWPASLVPPAGAWIELEVSPEESPGSRGGGATVYLGYLKSYQGMGLAFVECKSGCQCSPSHVDGLWQDRVSLMQLHAVAVRASVCLLPAVCCLAAGCCCRLCCQ